MYPSEDTRRDQYFTKINKEQRAGLEFVFVHVDFIGSTYCTCRITIEKTKKA